LAVQVHFPEKVGALREFLERLQSNFNVTMFHYRQTGNRSSSALLGIQVPESRQVQYLHALAGLEPHDFVFEELDQGTREVFDQFIS
jgi:threonine dehydratase